MTTALNMKDSIRGIQKTGRINAACHKAISERIAPGVTTQELDRFVERFLLDRGARPALKGDKGYPYAIFASVNDTVSSGFPDSVPLQSGDIVTIEMAAEANGCRADSAWTYTIGLVSESTKKLLRAAEEAMMEGIKRIRPGRTIDEIGLAIRRRAEAEGLRIVAACRERGNVRASQGLPVSYRIDAISDGGNAVLEEGMILTIGPILTAGASEVFLMLDGWEERTVNGSWTAHFMHTVAVKKKRSEVLTL